MSDAPVARTRVKSLGPHSIVLQICDRTVRCVDLEMLICLKRSAGLPEDFEVLAELQSLRLRKGDPEG